MTQFDLAHVACVAPLIGALSAAGAPVNRLLAHSGLDRFSVDNLNGFVPAECFHNFIEIAARRETGPSLPREIASRYILANMGGFGAEAQTCSDLRSAYLLASQPEARQLSYETVALDVHGVRAELSDTFAIPAGTPRTWIEFMTVSLIVDAVRTAAGPDWTPAEVHLVDGTGEGLDDLLSDDTVVVCNAPKVAVVFPTEILARPMRPERSIAVDTDPGPRLGPMTLTRIETVLDASTRDLAPTLETLADLSGMSPRTLQRRLGEEGLTFFEAVDRWRCNRALNLISDPGVTVGEIAERVRYSDASHFVRAFKRWTGVTPQSFRDSLSAPS